MDLTNTTTRQNRFVFISCTILICIGILVMIGWFASIPILTSFMNGHAAMKANTASGIILLAIALLIQTLWPQKGLFLSRVFSTLVIALGFFSLIQDVFNLNLGLDEVLITDFETRLKNNAPPGRMSPITAICFIAMGISLLVNRSSEIKLVIISQWLAHCVTFVAFTAILGYLFNVPVFYKLSFLTSMAVHTAVCFLIISISVSLIHPLLGVNRLFISNQIGNIMVRKLFMQMTIAILVLTFFRIEADRLQLVSGNCHKR